MNDAVFISLVNCGTSVFSAIVVYSILGFREVNNKHTCNKCRKRIKTSCKCAENMMKTL